MNSTMGLVKYREYPVENENIRDEAAVSIKANIPVTWLRDHFKVGDKLCVFMDSEHPDQLVITKSAVNSVPNAGATAC